MSKAVIYLRTSTDEQDPENQLEDCQIYAEQKGYDVVETYVEHGSAWKDVEREKYREIRERVRRENISAVIVWALDRWARNRKKLLEDMQYLADLGVNLHSVQDSYIEDFNMDGPMGETIRQFLINLAGTMAELESKRKSERIQESYKHHDGPWGRPGLSDSVVDEVISHHKDGMSYRDIRDEVTYYDNNRNKKHISLGKISDIVNEYKDMRSENTPANSSSISS